MTSQLQLFRTSLIYLLSILGIAERSEKEKIVLLHSASLHLYVSSCVYLLSLHNSASDCAEVIAVLIFFNDHVSEMIVLGLTKHFQCSSVSRCNFEALLNRRDVFTSHAHHISSKMPCLDCQRQK